MANKKIKLILVDDHQIVLDGLRLLLKNVNNFEIVFETTNPKIVLEKIKEIDCDILLTDIMMPEMDGLELSILARNLKPELKIVALSMNGDGASVYNMVKKAKINGYLLKTIGKAELEKALLQISDGESFFTEEILSEYEKYEQIIKQNEQINLTTREIEIIKCIANDLSNKQIASTLFISERTVETHRKNILRKTNTHSVVSLLDFVKKNNIV